MYWNAGTQHAKKRMIRVATATTTSTALNEDAVQSTQSFQYKPISVTLRRESSVDPVIKDGYYMYTEIVHQKLRKTQKLLSLKDFFISW